MDPIAGLDDWLTDPYDDPDRQCSECEAHIGRGTLCMACKTERLIEEAEYYDA